MRDFNPKEYTVTALRDCPVPAEMLICQEPDQVAAYWRLHIEKHPYFDPERECVAVLLLNGRKRVKGHQLLTMGSTTTAHVEIGLVFRSAIIASAQAIVLAHNHPSGDPSPSEADIKVTRELIKAAQVVKVEVVDHLIMGNPDYRSLRQLGYFYQ